MKLNQGDWNKVGDWVAGNKDIGVTPQGLTVGCWDWDRGFLGKGWEGDGMALKSAKKCEKGTRKVYRSSS